MGFNKYEALHIIQEIYNVKCKQVTVINFFDMYKYIFFYINLTKHISISLKKYSPNTFLFFEVLKLYIFIFPLLRVKFYFYQIQSWVLFLKEA